MIPDAIEPYLGWKSLIVEYVNDELILASPTQWTIWPVEHRLEAKCDSPVHLSAWEEKHDWKLTKGTPPSPYAYYTPGQISDFFSDTEVAAPVGFYYAPPDAYDYPPPPDLLPPEGYYWNWAPAGEKAFHEGTPIAGDYCSCGIYCVSRPAGVAGYLRSNCVIAQVAVWGTITRGSDGARGQYAYPQKLLIPRHLEKEGIEVAERYKVPYEVIAKAEQRRLLIEPLQLTSDEVSDAEVARDAFLSLSAGLMLFSAVCSFFNVGKWGLIPLIGGILCGLMSIVAHIDMRKDG